MNLLTAFRRGQASYRWADVLSEYDGHEACFRIFADAATVEGVRLSCSAREAQQCADLIGAILPTPRLLDLRHEQAQRKILPCPIHCPGDRGINSNATVRRHSAMIDKQDGRLGGILSPVGKHWCLHDRLTAARAVLYGWHTPYGCGRTWRGIPVVASVTDPHQGVIQGVSTAHCYDAPHYPTGLLLVSDECLVDGVRRRTAGVYTDPALAGLVTASGRPLRAVRLPGVPVETLPAHPSQEGSMGSRDTEFSDSAEDIDTPANLGLAVLELARQDVGVVEQPRGSNCGPRVAEYLATFGLRPPAHYCASALGTWLRAACQWLGVPRPIEGSAGAQATMGQFRAAGRWVAAGDPGFVAALRPGNVPVWRRGPPGSWQGHIGVIELRPVGSRFGTVEANSGSRGDEVARMMRNTDDERLLGVGILDDITPTSKHEPYAPSRVELDEAARLMALGADVMRGEDADPLAALEGRLRNG